MKVKYLIFSIVTAAFLTSAIGQDNSVEVGKMAPKIETIDGNNVVTDANTDGKDLIVNFWSPKKPASRIANRTLSREFGNNAETNVKFISICFDPDEQLMREVMKIDQINEEFNLAFSQINPRVFKDYGVNENPAAYRISSEGKISQIL